MSPGESHPPSSSNSGAALLLTFESVNAAVLRTRPAGGERSGRQPTDLPATGTGRSARRRHSYASPVINWPSAWPGGNESPPAGEVCVFLCRQCTGSRSNPLVAAAARHPRHGTRIPHPWNRLYRHAKPSRRGGFRGHEASAAPHRRSTNPCLGANRSQCLRKRHGTRTGLPPTLQPRLRNQERVRFLGDARPTPAARPDATDEVLDHGAPASLRCLYPHDEALLFPRLGPRSRLWTEGRSVALRREGRRTPSRPTELNPSLRVQGPRMASRVAVEPDPARQGCGIQTATRLGACWRAQMRPSCRIIPSSSLLPQRSTSLPSSKRLICIPRKLTDLPVGACPASSPRWVPVMVYAKASSSAVASRCSTSTCRSGRRA